MELQTFSLSDYDCIGFDLDCTLAEYNVKELREMVYDLMVKFLVEHKNYKRECFSLHFSKEEYFLQKGLFMDLKRGNVLKLLEEGTIGKASHGTKMLTEEEIISIYGEKKTFNAVKELIREPTSIINTPYEKELRGTFDCFDTPCILLFAQIVDYLDKNNGGVLDEYNVWSDILDGLYHLYSWSCPDSEFFNAMRKNPSKYYKKWKPEDLEWLKNLKKEKLTFVLTGSFIDFASETATYCIGDNWMDYFDLIICYARKPFFFFSGRPFLEVQDGKETKKVSGSELAVKKIYSQGNWEELKALIAKQTGKADPKCIYIGDNLIQDVYTPFHYNCCDSLAVCAELKENSQVNNFWGSYFEGNNNLCSYWNALIRHNAKICISDLNVMLKNPINTRYQCLDPNERKDISDSKGFYVD